jgi:ATP/maltotriose-dependent transcriptional regulator MalT
MDNMLLKNPILVEQFGAQILGVKGAIAHFSDSLDQYIDAIKAELENSPLAIPYAENALRALLAFDYLISDNFDGLTHLATEGLFFAKGGSLFFSTVYLKVTFAMMHFSQGNFEQCRAVCAEAEEFIDSQEHDSRLGHIIKVTRGMLAYVEGDLVQAKSLFDGSGKMVVNLAEPTFLAWYFPTHIQLLTDLGLNEQREILIDQLVSLVRSRHMQVSKTPLIYEAIACYLNQNNNDDAYALYDSFKLEMASLKSPINNHLLFNEQMIDCLVLANKGRYTKVRKILTDLSHQYELPGRVLQQVNCLIPLVNIHIENGKASLAKQTLKKVITIASKHNIIQYLARLDSTAIGYLSEWALTEWSPKRKAFMEDICQRFETPESKLPFSTVAIEQLTTGEKKVMELLGLGYSNQKIADKLSLSINTVKTHLKVSYAKLGVSNRVQANLLFSQIDFGKEGE